MRCMASCAALAASCVLSAWSDFAVADGLSPASPRQLLVAGAERVSDAARQTATPVPLRPGVFILPYATNQPGIGPHPDGAARFQAVDASFQAIGEPGTLITGLADCGASFAENGGAKLGGGITQLALPVYLYDGSALEVLGRSVAADGEPLVIGERLNRRREGHQSGPVIIPMRGGTAFALWSDFFHGAGESEASVWGALVAADGKTSGAAS